MKKVVATMPVGVMLLGAMVSAQAAEPAKPHTHAYSRMRSLVYSEPYATHQYVAGTYTDGNGNVITKYGECAVGFYRYLEYDACACGAEDHSHDKYVEKLKHPSCGLGTVMYN